MGLLSLGTPLDWPETQKLAEHVRTHGITQLLSLWNKVKDRRGDKTLWGDEIEYIVVSFDEDDHNARLSLRQGEILKVLSQSHERSCEIVAEQDNDPSLIEQIPTFHPEYGRFMLESTPGCPYGASPKELTQTESNMRMRRRIAQKHLRPNELPITLTSFPRLGVTDTPFLDDDTIEANGNASQSLFLPDEIINQHARFPTLTANIRKRRGSKVAINLPIYRDVNTPSPFIDPLIPWDRQLFPSDAEAKNGAAKPDHIYMDAMGFGMGCCCLQVTFQACSINEARAIYDQLVPVTPLILALTAASPAYRGYLADVDARWSVISGAVDDRTPEERGERPLEGNQTGSRMRMPKSRYDSVDSYLSLDSSNRREYNDNPLPIDEAVYERLQKAGMDPLLAAHFAHLFIRDPLVIFSEMVDQDDEDSTDHFENIQSTNWQTMRFKPPPLGDKIGWRVEVRSMEVQVTDFENAAFSVFIVLLTRAILSFRLNFYLPISKVDINMGRAQKRDAALEEKFFFRRDVYDSRRNPHSSATSRCATPVGSRPQSRAASARPDPSANGHRHSQHPSTSSDSPYASRAHSPGSGARIEEEFGQYSLNELINGTKAASRRQQRANGHASSEGINGHGNSGEGDQEEGEEDDDDGAFPGLVPLVHTYLDSLSIDLATRAQMDLYLDLVSKRASGELITTAKWIRNYVRSHPQYKGDSRVTKDINYDMIKTLDLIEKGALEAPGFLPDGYAKRRRDLEAKETSRTGTRNTGPTATTTTTTTNNPPSGQGTASAKREGAAEAVATAEMMDSTRP